MTPYDLILIGVGGMVIATLFMWCALHGGSSNDTLAEQIDSQRKGTAHRPEVGGAVQSIHNRGTSDV